MATFTKSYQFDLAQKCPNFKFAPAYTRIMELLDDEALVKKHLMALDSLVKKSFDDMSKKDSNYTKAQALYDILRESEILHKFDASKVAYITGVIKTADQFYYLMDKKLAFLDPNVTPKHGAETHRIQWWIIGRDMADKAKIYGAKVASEVYAAAADKTARNDDKGTNNAWYNALDADQGSCNSARAPECLKEYINAKFKNIAEAEALQMKWDSAVKMTYDKKSKLGNVGSKSDKNFDLFKYPS
jgi:hypothetical protein